MPLSYKQNLSNLLLQKWLQRNRSYNSRRTCTQILFRIENQPDPLVARVKMSQNHFLHGSGPLALRYIRNMKASL